MTGITNDVDDLKSRVQLAALAIKTLKENLLERDKEIDRLTLELQLINLKLDNEVKK